uniref:RepB protein n=1 Tax=Lactiplantibacillus plantarum TaxID=1590 RepID=Q48831_LACPN|nr:replication protein B [Lactiplantibacillus plantarum]ADU77110.1 replication protein B [Shuttle DNA vaccine vector pLKV1]CAA77780.1 repB [Lactiplantibacillus plantarum]CAR79031.1 replication protein [Cloning shuttle vector pA13]
MTKKKYEYEKGRDWTFIVYPESAPDNWRTVLDETHLLWIESPLHDKDMNADGEIKKSHYHILLTFDGPVTEKQVIKLIDPLNTPLLKKLGCPRWFSVVIWHIWTTLKNINTQRDEIVGHCGADVESYFELTKTSKMSVMKTIITYIYEIRLIIMLIFNDLYSNILMIGLTYRLTTTTLAINKMIDGMWLKKKNELR